MSKQINMHLTNEEYKLFISIKADLESEMQVSLSNSMIAKSILIKSCKDKIQSKKSPKIQKPNEIKSFKNKYEQICKRCAVWEISVGDTIYKQNNEYFCEKCFKNGGSK